MAGRNTYDDSDGSGGPGGPHPTAPLIVVSHRPAPPEATDKQTFVMSIGRKITLTVLGSYMAIAMVLVIVRIVQLAIGS